MKIVVVGGGVVGVVAAAGFASAGHCVVCCERDRRRLRGLKDARAPLGEPRLDMMIAEYLRAGSLTFASNITAARDADVCFIAVETDAGECAALRAAVCDAALAMGGRGIIAVKSTMPAGMADALAKTTGADIVVNPEFLRQGYAAADFLHPKRIVIGADNPQAFMTMRAVYKKWRAPIIQTSRRTAEVIKLAANYALAARVAVINDIAALCELGGDDTAAVVNALAYDERINPARQGPGFGGVCLPKDCALFAAACGRGASLAAAVIAANNKRPQTLAAHIAKHFARNSRPHLAVWGLAFKGGGGDMTNSKAMETAKLLGKTAPRPLLRLHDPFVPMREKKLLPGKRYRNWRDTLKNADGVVILAAHPQYSSIARADIKAAMKKEALIFDTVGILQTSGCSDYLTA